MSARLIVITFAFLLTMSVMLPVSDDSRGASFEDSFSLKLMDSEGRDLSDPLFGNVTIFFDTIDTEHGTIYKLKAMLSIRTIPANLLITSSGGLFRLAVTASGLGSFIDSTGMRITITDSSNVFTADLKSESGYSAEFKNGANTAALDPNVNYSVSISLIDGYDSLVPPESISSIKITFQAIASEGFHQVMFISQDETIESYMAFDNYVIEEVPSVSRSGYAFKGWYTADGKEITDGYIISKDDGDIIAFANWEKEEGSGIMLYIAGGGGAAGLAALLLFALKKKKESE